jgi:SAM-dependent methyltransferase
VSLKQHWESVYQSKEDAQLSWTQAEPRLSLALIEQAISRGDGGRVIDVGGGTSVLADRLLDAGYCVAVLDISGQAIERAQARMGARADTVRWIVADVTDAGDIGQFDIWHDRAVFHFLTDPANRAAYVALLCRSLAAGGHAVIATFALDGPEKCSGLPVRRYDAPALLAELGAGFELVNSVAETHLTPWGNAQSFQFSLLRRV